MPIHKPEMSGADERPKKDTPGGGQVLSSAAAADEHANKARSTAVKAPGRFVPGAGRVFSVLMFHSHALAQNFSVRQFNRVDDSSLLTASQR